MAVIPFKRSIRWACANKACPKKNLPVLGKNKPDCSLCHKPLKAA